MGKIVFFKLRDICNRRGIDQQTLCKLADVSRNTTSKLWNNKPVDLSIIAKICNALDVQPGDLMEFQKTE